MDYSDEDIAFLANSENRVALLQSLTDGPHSRHVLEERTGVSRVTLGRILIELEDRDWVTQRGQICEITTLGAWVIEEYLAFKEMMDAERRLRDVIQWFPQEDYGFHVSHLADAKITAVSRANASAPLSQRVHQFEEGGRFWSFSSAITRLFLETCWNHVMDGSVTFEWVFTSEVLDVLRSDPRMASQSREMLDSGGAEYRHYDGEFPYIVLGSDEMINLRLADDEGSPTALVQSNADDVRRWAESTFEEYWRDGMPVEANSFTA